MAKRTLKAVQGSDEVTDGTTRFPIDPISHTVELPEDVAERTLHGGGFVDVTDPVPELPSGLARRRNPSGSGCSWGGFSYEADASGVVIVPVVAEPDLASHGFTRVADAPPAEVEPESGPETEASADPAPAETAPADDTAEAPAAESAPETEAGA